MSFTDSASNDLAHRCIISQVVAGKGEREKMERKLDHKCSSPSVPVRVRLRILPNWFLPEYQMAYLSLINPPRGLPTLMPTYVEVRLQICAKEDGIPTPVDKLAALKLGKPP